jgi:phosphatidylglycerophosphatase A
VSRAEALSTLFGIGRISKAPGTVASAAALPFAALISLSLGPFILLLYGFAAFALGCWSCNVYARDTGKDDPSECVIDELAGQWIACAFVPFSIISFLVAFALFRLFDIWKPWPVSWGEKFPGGIGIMADDVIAGAIAGLLTAVAAYYGIR